MWRALAVIAVLMWPVPSSAQDEPGQDGSSMPVDRPPPSPPPPSPLIYDLQLNLQRLGYYDGAADGLHSDDLLRAVLAFERDEQVPPEAESTPELLQLSHAAISRIPSGGECPDAGAAAAGTSVACGSIR